MPKKASQVFARPYYNLYFLMVLNFGLEKENEEMQGNDHKTI
jgi:hypothetical protein